MASSLPLPRKIHYPLQLTKNLLQLELQRVGIAVEGLIIGVFVGVKEDAGLATSILVARRTIRGQAPDVLSGKFF